MKTVKNPGVFHFFPFCCAEQVVNGKWKKVNWLWLRWMFCLEPNQTLDLTRKAGSQDQF